ncbi:MAG: hypothetical protein QF895_02975 [SAR86 cluster bacterium]|jgi:hypothetical protein|nr:hypothetical protein [SAR86 cluster bacterium]
MPTIKIDTTKTETGWIFKVTVSNGTSTVHNVNLTNDYYNHLSIDIKPDKLVESSFAFLLEREPKEMILGTFDLQTISRYFPEYERRIAEYV